MSNTKKFNYKRGFLVSLFFVSAFAASTATLIASNALNNKSDKEITRVADYKQLYTATPNEYIPENTVNIFVDNSITHNEEHADVADTHGRYASYATGIIIGHEEVKQDEWGEWQIFEDKNLNHIMNWGVYNENHEQIEQPKKLSYMNNIYYVLTNKHLFADKDGNPTHDSKTRIYVRTNAVKFKENDNINTENTMYPLGFYAELVDVHPTMDLAILRTYAYVNDNSHIKFEYEPESNIRLNPEPGETVVTYGNAKGNGIIKTQFELLKSRPVKEGYEALVSDQPIVPGMSGGPIFDSNNNLIGITYAATKDEYALHIPMSAIIDYIKPYFKEANVNILE